MQYTHKKINKGFTVIEAMVAIAMLLLSISGSFAVAQSSLQSSGFVKNRITAYYLAQEGVEYIRNLRDVNGLKMLENRTSDISWLDGLASSESDPCYFGNKCIVDITGETVPQVCGGGGCPNLFFDPVTNLFQYDQDTGVDSGFKRTIMLLQQTGDGGDPDMENQIIVNVTVEWNQNGIQKSLDVSENLYNWQALQPLDFQSTPLP